MKRTAGREPGFSSAMASFHPSDSLHRCLKPGWIKRCKSAAELQGAANSLASYPNTARLVLMTPAFSVLAQENRMIPGPDL